MIRKTTLILVSSALCSLSLGGCVPLFVAGAATGVTAISQERGVGGAVQDTEIQTKINDKWLRADSDMLTRLDITTRDQRVLLTGTARSEEQRSEAVRLAWQVTGVRDVINEIQVGTDTSFTRDSKDAWLTTQVANALLWDSKIKNQNYKVETHKGVVYLIGEAQNQEELDRVLAHARAISGVKRVVSYVQIL